MGTFGESVEDFVQHLDHGWVIAGAGQVHCGLEVGDEFGVLGIGSDHCVVASVDGSFDGDELGADVGVGFELCGPLGTHVVICVGTSFGGRDIALGLDIDKLLSLVIGQSEFFE